MGKLIFFQTVTPPLDIFSLVKTDPYLVVDTSLYPPEFQAALLTRLSKDFLSLDAATDGLLIHSDNFQALNLLQARYREQVKCIYIDPPYNTKNDGFIYKDSYQHSSWASFIQTRLQLTYCLLKNSGSIFISIDDNEQSYLKFLCNETFGEQQFIGQICWHRKRGKDNSAPNLSRVHEYILPYAKNISNLNFNRLDMDSETLKAYRNPDNDIRGNYRVLGLWARGGQGGSNYSYTTKNGTYYSEREWLVGLETMKRLDLENRLIENGDKLYRKLFVSETSGAVPETIWLNTSNTANASDELKAIFNTKNQFDTPKPVPLILQILKIGSQNNDLILDYFAGSGTTAHAVINLNREDGGKRKYILVEQAEYFNTVLKPRVQKVIYSKEWKDGKPQADSDGNCHGVPQIVKVLKLESYEDTLNNLQLKKPDLLARTLNDQSAQDYLLHYMLDIESRDSLLSTDDFRKPFDYRLNIASDSAGAYAPQVIDLVETFNYLLGLRVDSVEDRRYDKGYVFVEGRLNGELVLLLWRDCERWDYDGLQRLLAKKKIKPQESEFAEIYINGDHTLPTVWQDNDAEGGMARTLKIRSIEAEFLRLMFAEAE